MEQFRQTVFQLNNQEDLPSLEVLNQSISATKAFLQRQGGFNSASWEETLVTGLNQLIGTHAHNFALFHFINELFLFIESKPQYTVTSTEALEFVRIYENHWKKAADTLIENAIAGLNFHNKTILVHSSSELVLRFLKVASLNEQRPIVYQTLSRPSAEGKEQAKLLASMGYTVNFIDEISAGRFVHFIDFALLSADAILTDQYIAKAGSMLIALACNRLMKPVYLLADSRRFLNEQLCDPALIKALTKESPKNSDQLWTFPPRGIKLLNYHYDATPNDVLIRFITESGLFKPEQVFDHYQQSSISRLFHFYSKPNL